MGNNLVYSRLGCHLYCTAWRITLPDLSHPQKGFLLYFLVIHIKWLHLIINNQNWSISVLLWDLDFLQCSNWANQYNCFQINLNRELRPHSTISGHQFKLKTARCNAPIYQIYHYKFVNSFDDQLQLLMFDNRFHLSYAQLTCM